MSFEDTFLHDITKLGGMEPIGAGSPGGTVWAVTTSAGVLFVSTYLHDIRILGGMEPVGAGSPGGTVWETTE